MKVHVKFVELAEKLRCILDEQYDLTDGSGLPLVGDVVHIHDKGRPRQFWVVERHWNVGVVIGMVTIYVTSKRPEGALNAKTN